MKLGSSTTGRGSAHYSPSPSVAFLSRRFPLVQIERTTRIAYRCCAYKIKPSKEAKEEEEADVKHAMKQDEARTDQGMQTISIVKHMYSS